METILSLAAANLLSPMVLFFVLGFAAALARSDLSIPEAVAKGMSLYLLFAIGFKGGAGVAESGLSIQLGSALVAGAVLSATIPLIAFLILRAISRLGRTDAAAVAAHYGSISIVTFVAMTSMLSTQGVEYEGFMVAVAAIMEAPAILTALVLANATAPSGNKRSGVDRELMREVMLNSSIVLLIGSFAIGWITGTEGLAKIESFIVSPFQGVLCLFLLDMGIIAGRGMRDSRGEIAPPVIAFGMVMPLIGAALGLVVGMALGLSTGGVAVLMTLCASASYIAVPAAMRVALPEAKPSIYLTLSLGVTFPFNLTVGISLYLAAAQLFSG
ncbi:MAG: sodium-dependent bicarbonate transport family permease [Rubricella sp.]